LDFHTYKKELIRHELGHWFVAKELGFARGDIRLKIIEQFGNFGHQGSSTIFPEPHIDNLKKLDSYLINRICILYAGVATQLIFLNDEEISSNKTESLLDSYGTDDNSKIQELLFIVRGIRFNKNEIIRENELNHRNEITDEAWKKCCSIIESKKKDIQHLCLKIDENIQSLDHEYVIEYKDLSKWLEEL
jgi:hypothetical protein